ncbi:hypothetical protein [Streptomyces sp. NPDC006668]|uniref:hypothetical protein n=1 Tax=Streptomyces sp. NPDC006668 TaxID=3156903 RepID=UPI0033D1CD71
MEGWKFWWGIAAFFLGGLATQLNGWLTYRRQRLDKAADAADAARSRRDEFELQHLLGTSQRLYAYRELFLTYTTVVKKARADEEHDLPLTNELSLADEALNDAERALHEHVGFILDDEIRRKVRAAMDMIGDGAAASLIGAPVDYRSTSETVNDALDSLAARVRQLYASQAAS